MKRYITAVPFPLLCFYGLDGGFKNELIDAKTRHIFSTSRNYWASTIPLKYELLYCQYKYNIILLLIKLDSSRFGT